MMEDRRPSTLEAKPGSRHGRAMACPPREIAFCRRLTLLRRSGRSVSTGSGESEMRDTRCGGVCERGGGGAAVRVLARYRNSIDVVSNYTKRGRVRGTLPSCPTATIRRSADSFSAPELIVAQSSSSSLPLLSACILRVQHAAFGSARHFYARRSVLCHRCAGVF